MRNGTNFCLTISSQSQTAICTQEWTDMLEMKPQLPLYQGIVQDLVFTRLGLDCEPELLGASRPERRSRLLLVPFVAWEFQLKLSVWNRRKKHEFNELDGDRFILCHAREVKSFRSHLTTNYVDLHRSKATCTVFSTASCPLCQVMSSILKGSNVFKLKKVYLR